MKKKPTLIAIGGFAGAGKSTLASRLSAEYNYPIYSSDTINDALRSSTNMGFKTASPIAYQMMWHLVRKQLTTGITLIVDAHMAAPHIWESLDKLKCDMPEVKIMPIILQASLDTHKDRIDERGRTNKDHLNLGGDKLEDVLFKYEFIENLNRPDLMRIDANKTKDEVYSEVIKVISDSE